MEPGLDGGPPTTGPVDLRNMSRMSRLIAYELGLLALWGTLTVLFPMWWPLWLLFGILTGCVVIFY